VSIITVWVDDLLLFASDDEHMKIMKNNISSLWTATDLGKPSKIIGIEITVNNDSVTMSQQKYLETILRKEGMENTNPVSMPLNPNMKLEPNLDDNEPN